MTLLWPWMLGLGLIPLALVSARWLWSRRTGGADAPWPNILRGHMVGGRVRLDAGKRRVPWRLWLAAALAVVALTRPQGGDERGAPTQPAGDIIIALDLSRSMLADDVRPSRLAQARRLAEGLVDALPEQRIGLVGFAGTAHALAPVSADRALLGAFLATAQPSHMPVQGSNLAALADAALAALPGRGARVLVVLTDGEADASPWRERAPALKAAGIGVLAVGFGTAEGALLSDGGNPVRLPTGGQVRTRLQSRTLADFTTLAGGRVLSSPDAATLAATVRQALAAAGTPEAANDEPRPVELFPWFLFGALLLLGWSAAAEWPGRPRLRTRTFGAVPAALAGLALLLIRAPLLAQQPIPPDLALLENEGDPLENMQTIVSDILKKPRPDADDWQAVAEAALRYGEVHRVHAHPLQEGVLTDGLAAVAAGRRLDPGRADWAVLDSKLKHYLEPPPLVPPDGEGPADAANEPVDAKREAPVLDKGLAPDDAPPPGDRQPEAAENPNMQKVGGGEANLYDPEEWRNPSLVRPLHELQRLRAVGTPAEMFRLMQAGSGPPRRAGEQTW